MCVDVCVCDGGWRWKGDVVAVVLVMMFVIGFVHVEESMNLQWRASKRMILEISALLRIY